MHTIELLEHAVDLAGRLGYEIRYEWLDGVPGGAIELGGRKIVFLDLAMGPIEQLAQVLDALGRQPQAAELPMPFQLRDLIGVRKSA